MAKARQESAVLQTLRSIGASNNHQSITAGDESKAGRVLDFVVREGISPNQRDDFVRELAARIEVVRQTRLRYGIDTTGELLCANTVELLDRALERLGEQSGHATRATRAHELAAMPA